MNNLEFIESLIQGRELSLKSHKQLLEQIEYQEYSCEEEKQLLIKIYKEDIEELEKSIVLLHQIKTELEAWEVIKTDVKDFFSIRIHNNITDKDWEKVKKALKRGR